VRIEGKRSELVGDLDLVPTTFQQSNGKLLVDLVVLGEQNVEEDVLGLEGEGKEPIVSGQSRVEQRIDLNGPDLSEERCATRGREGER